MNEQIFRKKSYDKIKSPESLDDYIRVSNPGVWLLLISIVVLLIGAGIWGVFGHIDSTVSTIVCVENGNVTCEVCQDEITGITEGLTVRFDGKEATIDDIELVDSIYICTLKIDDTIVDGYYDGKIVTETYKPISFISN